MEKLYNQIASFTYGVVLYLQIDTEVAAALVYLILIDMFFGTLKAVLVPEMKFSLNVFWVGLIKKATLLAIVMVLALLGKGLGFEDFRSLLTTVMKIMLVNEALSIFNCFRSIKDRKEYKSSDFISLLIQKIESFLNFQLKKLMKIFDNNAENN